MRKLFGLFAFLTFCSQAFSQNVVVTDDASYTTGNTSAVLDVKSVLKGFLAPRMTQAQRTAIATPADGLLVYQTDATKGFYYYNGTTAAWVLLTAGSSSTGWSLTGNSGTSSSTNFLGTTDNTTFKMRTNNTQRMLIDSLGNIGIGSAPVFTTGTAREKLLVDAGSSTNPTTSFNVISGKGYIDNYLQLNIQNKAGTGSASSDVVASNDAATELVDFVDLGINSSGYTGTGVIGGASNGYLYSTGNDFSIGNGTAGKSLIFFTGGVAANERMRIDGSGNVGVATTSPAAKLDVAGTYKLGSSGTVLTNMIKTSITFTDNTGFLYTSPTEVETVTVTGATVNATVIVNPRTALPNSVSLAWARVVSSNTVAIGFVNADTSTHPLGTVTCDVTIIQ